MSFDKPIAVITAACEASNRSHSIRQCVIWTIKNRRDSGKFPPTMAGVCLKRMQFSEWNADAADNANLERVANMRDDDPVLVDCALAYDEVMSGGAFDPTGKATHFYAVSIDPPNWTIGANLTLEREGIRFYRDVK